MDSFSITVGNVTRLNAQTGVDLLAAEPEKQLIDLFQNPLHQLTFLEILGVPGVDELKGDQLKEAFTKLKEAVRNFFQTLYPDRDQIFETAMEQMAALTTTVLEAMTEMMEETKVDLKKKAKAEMKKAILK